MCERLNVGEGCDISKDTNRSQEKKNVVNHIVRGISDKTDVVDTEDIDFSNNIVEQVETHQGSADLDLIDSDHCGAIEEAFCSEEKEGTWVREEGGGVLVEIEPSDAHTCAIISQTVSEEQGDNSYGTLARDELRLNLSASEVEETGEVGSLDDVHQYESGEQNASEEKKKVGSSKLFSDDLSASETEGKEVTENTKPLKWILTKREVQEGAIQIVYRSHIGSGAEHPLVDESNLLEVEVSDDEWGSLWEEVLQEDARARETEATTSLQMSEPPSKKGEAVRTENNQEAVELGEVLEVSATVEAVEEPLQDLLLVEQEVMELGEVTTTGDQMEMEGKNTEAEGELQAADLGLKEAEEDVPATRISSTEGEVGMEDQMENVRCENVEFGKLGELKDNLTDDVSYIINEALNALDEGEEVEEVADENFNIVKNVVKQCFVRLPRLSKFLWVGLIVEKVQVGKRRPGHGPRSAVWVKKIRGLKSGHSKGSWKVIDAGS